MNNELFDWNVWAAPVFVLGFTLLLGVIMALRSWRGAPVSDGSQQAAEEALLARKEALLEQIRMLDADRGKLEESERLRRREALLAEASEVLKALDELGSEGASGDAAAGLEAEQGSAAASQGRRSNASLVQAAVFVVVFAAIGLMLGRYSSDRAQGQSMTGNTSQSELQIRIEAAQTKLEADPVHLESLNFLTYMAILLNDSNAAMHFSERARGVDPNHPDTHLNLAVLALKVNMVDLAAQELASAEEADPDMERLLLWKGTLALRMGNREAAVALLEQALGTDLNRLEQQLATQMLAEAKAPPPQDRLMGTVSLAEGIPAPEGGMLFFIVRSSEAGAGPPVASVRMPGVVMAQGPTDFVITDDDLMLGGGWPEEAWLSARLDRDGDPLTRDANDLVFAPMGPLASGADGLEVVLQAQEGAELEASEGDGAASGARVSGTLSLADGTELPEGGVLFIIAQRAGQSGGPPVAVVKKGAEDLVLPYTFSLSDADMMMGGTWPEQVWLKARVDADGDAMTRSDEDVEATVVGPLSSGAADVELVLGK